ncbi:MAG: MarR family winged helix-turn-helix transcriptional regulator [Anaerotignum sp.]
MKETEVVAVRKFNRYYTNLLGLLDQHILESDYSLAETRVLYEIEKAESITMRKISEILTMDEGYLSRILKRLEKNGLISRVKSTADGRAYLLSLTEQGQVQMLEMNSRSDRQIRGFLAPLSPAQRAKLVKNMQNIESILSGLPLEINE